MGGALVRLVVVVGVGGDATGHEGAVLDAHESLHVALQPAPGGDFELAMGVARYLFDAGAVAPDAAEFCDHLDAFRAMAEGATVAEWAARCGLEEAR